MGIRENVHIYPHRIKFCTFIHQIFNDEVVSFRGCQIKWDFAVLKINVLQHQNRKYSNTIAAIFNQIFHDVNTPSPDCLVKCRFATLREHFTIIKT